MDITEKMKLCFNDKLESNEILTENEKKILASLLYSYKICKEAKNGILIRGIDEIRKDTRISTNSLYDAMRNLESLYQMFEWTRGEKRMAGKPSKAAQFKLNFNKIFNPPVEPLKFNFEDEFKSSETPINTAIIDTDTEINIETIEKTDSKVDEKKNLKETIKTDIETVSIGKNEDAVEKDAEVLRKLKIKKQLENELKEWTVKVNNGRKIS